jgi:hypothetical protein
VRTRKRRSIQEKLQIVRETLHGAVLESFYGKVARNISSQFMDDTAH